MNQWTWLLDLILCLHPVLYPVFASVSFKPIALTSPSRGFTVTTRTPPDDFIDTANSNYAQQPSLEAWYFIDISCRNEASWNRPVTGGGGGGGTKSKISSQSSGIRRAGMNFRPVGQPCVHSTSLLLASARVEGFEGWIGDLTKLWILNVSDLWCSFQFETKIVQNPSSSFHVFHVLPRMDFGSRLRRAGGEAARSICTLVESGLSRSSKGMKPTKHHDTEGWRSLKYSFKLHPWYPCASHVHWITMTNWPTILSPHLIVSYQIRWYTLDCWIVQTVKKSLLRYVIRSARQRCHKDREARRFAKKVWQYSKIASACQTYRTTSLVCLERI